MKKLLIGFLALVSVSAFEENCKLKLKGEIKLEEQNRLSESSRS